MPANRFFSPTSTLEGEELHHLHVMRIRPGDTIELVNGQGTLSTAKVLTLDKKRATLEILSQTTSPAPRQNLILAQAFTRTLDWLLEKGTELGVTEFWLFPGDQSEKKNPSLPRLQTIAISALKQSGRLFLPKITLLPPLSKWKPPAGTLFFGDLSKEAPRLQGPFSDTVVFFIGPEKGFSVAELELLKTFQAQGISLHKNILRAETAAIAALSQFYLFKSKE